MFSSCRRAARRCFGVVTDRERMRASEGARWVKPSFGKRLPPIIKLLSINKRLMFGCSLHWRSGCSDGVDRVGYLKAFSLGHANTRIPNRAPSVAPPSPPMRFMSVQNVIDDAEVGDRRRDASWIPFPWR